MKYVAILLMFVCANTYAAWGGFALVTPETAMKYGLDLEIQPILNGGNYKVKFNALGYSHKNAWLIITSSAMSEKEQQLRGYIWGETEVPRKLIMQTKLNPTDFSEKSGKENGTRYYEVIISKELIKNAYVYIDFPGMVFDGGYYYSIDLGAFYLNQIKASNVAHEK